MRDSRDRRTPTATDHFPFSDTPAEAQEDRRKCGERRLENLNAEERQLMLSEMPAPIEEESPPGEQD